MTPTSVPVIPAQPNLPQYPATALQTLQNYGTIQAFEAAFGAPPPAYDRTRPIQPWFDSTASALPGAAYMFQYAGTDANGNPAILQMAILASQAGMVNVPGPEDVANPVLGGMPFPVRALLANEQLAILADGGGPGVAEVVVNRTDMAAGLPAPGGWTNADRALAQANSALLQSIATKLGVTV